MSEMSAMGGKQTRQVRKVNVASEQHDSVAAGIEAVELPAERAGSIGPTTVRNELQHLPCSL